METQLKFVRLLSLKEMALRRVVVLLWSSSDALDSVQFFRDSSLSTTVDRKKWKETTEDAIREEILKLDLPKSLLTQMTDIIRPVGLEIKRWFNKHTAFLSNADLDSPKLCWTTSGAINYLKTAELLNSFSRNHDNIHTVLQSCAQTRDGNLENYITFLWKKLSRENMELELPTENLPLDRNGMMLPNRLKFAYSLQNRNKTAAEYFLQKLSLKERELILMIIVRDDLLNLRDVNYRYCPDEDTSEVLCYLLSLIPPEHQMEIVKSRPLDVLLCLFHWPWQDLYLQNAGVIWSCIPSSEYGELVQMLIDYFSDGDYHFPKPFRDFFTQSPLDFKKYFVESEVDDFFMWEIEASGTPACRFLYIFFDNEDSECIEVVFRNVDAEARAKLVFHREVLRLFYQSISKHRWHLVEVCLREATLCKKDREKLQRDFMAFLESRNEKWRNRKWKSFFKFLGGVETSTDKEVEVRRLQLENCCPG